MSGPQLERAAYLLADHALWLVGLCVVAAVLLLGAVSVAVRLGRRLRPLLPGAYLALHLALGLGTVSAVSAFAALTEATVAGDEVVTFDVAFTRALQHRRTPEWDGFFRTVSVLGTGPALAAVTVVVAVLITLRHERLLAFGWVIAQAGGGLLNRVLKETFERSRPEFADSALAATSWSFPSGHAMGTVILCGMGCYVLVRQARSWAALVGFLAFALSWCIVIAFSRLYLGVHFASDVIGGLLAGLAWVTVCVSGIEVVRMNVEGPGAITRDLLDDRLPQPAGERRRDLPRRDREAGQKS